MTGIKYDTDKVRWELMPWSELEQVAKVMAYGAEKYDADNWKHLGGARPRYFAAALRHLFAWWRGETDDPESGLPHLAHAACNVLFLLWFEGHGG